MTDLRMLLRAVTPEPAELDVAGLKERARRLGRRRRRAQAGATAVALALTVAVALLLPGRGGQETLTPAGPGPATSATQHPSTGATQDPTPDATASPTDGTSPLTGTPAFPADTRPDLSTGSGRVLAVTGVRVGAQDGYDRVVLDLAGDRSASAGWRVEYVDRPVAEGSGAQLAVAGSAYLQVVVTGLDWTDLLARQLAYRGGPVTPAGTLLVRQVVPGGVFEGRAQFVIGTTGRTPFRVFQLSDPARIVVDVRP